jgi:hypothetical protein
MCGSVGGAMAPGEEGRGDPRCGSCRMDLPGPTTSMGTRTDYSVGAWDYSTWAT